MSSLRPVTLLLKLALPSQYQHATIANETILESHIED